MLRKYFDKVSVTSHPKSIDDADQFQVSFDEKGNAHYKKVKSYKISAYVSSFEKGCSLVNMLQRCSLMPIHSKVELLNQVPTVNADMTLMPKDLTEAFMMADSLKRDNPDIVKRLNSGESIDSVLKSLIPNKEVTTDGTNESSHD